MHLMSWHLYFRRKRQLSVSRSPNFSNKYKHEQHSHNNRSIINNSTTSSHSRSSRSQDKPLPSRPQLPNSQQQLLRLLPVRLYPQHFQLLLLVNPQIMRHFQLIHRSMPHLQIRLPPIHRMVPLPSQQNRPQLPNLRYQQFLHQMPKRLLLLPRNLHQQPRHVHDQLVPRRTVP